MILAGIDEAGLGPKLGPLCVVCAALRTPEGWSAAVPWQALSAAIADKPGRAEKRLVVADSKKVFAARSLAALERTSLTFFSTWPSAEPLPLPRSVFLAILGAFETIEDIARCPWYAHDWLAPICCTPAAIKDEALRLFQAMAAAGAAVAGLQARVTVETIFNRRIAAGLNKAQALWYDIANHLRWLAESFPDEAIAVCVDKQGGRHAYLPLLASSFPGALWQAIAEGALLSEYVLQRRGPPMHVAFIPRAEQTSFAVALASIMAKYLRERFMLELNDFFIARLPNLHPTAGYPADAPRFIAAVRPLLAQLGVSEDSLVRCR